MVVDVLDTLKADNDVETVSLGNGHVRDRAGQETQVRTAVLGVGVPYGGFVEVDSNYRGGFTSQRICPIAFSAGEVEHALTLYELRRIGVSVQVLVCNRRFVDPREESLACPLKQGFSYQLAFFPAAEDCVQPGIECFGCTIRSDPIHCARTHRIPEVLALVQVDAFRRELLRIVGNGNLRVGPAQLLRQDRSSDCRDALRGSFVNLVRETGRKAGRGDEHSILVIVVGDIIDPAQDVDPIGSQFADLLRLVVTDHRQCYVRAQGF